MRPAYWTSRPFWAMGAARKRVSSGGQANPSPAYGPVAAASRRAARLGLEPGERGGPCFGAHAAAQDDGVVAYRAQRLGELVQVRGPVSGHKAVSVAEDC